MSPAAVSLGRIGAMVLRYTYLLRSSWPRLLEMIYWPAVQIMTWGFLQTYLVRAQGVVPNIAAIAAGALIDGVLLWDILLRGQQGFSFSFLEEMWSRNIPNLLMSPLRPAEFVVALMVMSLIRLAVRVVPVTLMAISFFGFNLWALTATSKSSATTPRHIIFDWTGSIAGYWTMAFESRAGRAVLTEKTDSLRNCWASRQYPGEYRLYPRELI